MSRERSLTILAPVEDARDNDFLNTDAILDDVRAAPERHDQFSETGLRSRSSSLRELVERLNCSV
jgi:hypothetical protein